MIKIDELIDDYKVIENPKDYYKGVGQLVLPIPNNVLCFIRNSYGLLGLSSFVQSHHRYVCIFNLKDPIDIVIDGKLQTVGKEEGLIILPFQYHKFRMPNQEKQIFGVFITFEMEDNTYLESFRYNNFKLDETIIGYLKEFISLYNLENSEKIPLIAGLLLTHIYSKSYLVSKAISIKMMKDNLLHKITLLINQDLHLNVIDLSKKLDYSESYLRSYFKREMGVSLGNYIIELRITKALFYLYKDSDSISEISYKCGYESIYSFSRVFKKIVHFSPKEFRDKVKINPEIYNEFWNNRCLEFGNRNKK